MDSERIPALGERGLRRRAQPRGGSLGARSSRRRDVRRLSRGAVRPDRSPLPVPVPELHRLRAALHDRHRASRTTGRRRRWPASRCAPDCRREYEDPADRRFHAEPIACPACGPQLSVPLEDAVDVLCSGRDRRGEGARRDTTWPATRRSEAAVARLRARKGREEKPLAVMTAEPDAIAEPTPVEEALLRSTARPIVLVRRRPDARWRSRSPPDRRGSA